MWFLILYLSDDFWVINYLMVECDSLIVDRTEIIMVYISLAVLHTYTKTHTHTKGYFVKMSIDPLLFFSPRRHMQLPPSWNYLHLK